MQAPEEAEIAVLVSEFSKDYEQYLATEEVKESAFRVAVMQLYINSEKEKQLNNDNPILELYKNSAEKITDRMVELSEDISEERQRQIIASVPFYFKNQRCFNCKKPKSEERHNHVMVSNLFSKRCFNCKKNKKR